MEGHIFDTPLATGIGTTLTSGIQDIAALLPLLGTEQCEEHVGSALSDGYLYAAASPISVFGSLGIARAGLKTLLASLSIPLWGFSGAVKLRNTGFRPSGQNLSLIMMDPENVGCHLAETRVDSILKTLRIDALHSDDISRLTVTAACLKWNFKTLLVTAITCGVGLTPYIYLNASDKFNRVDLSTRWAFPVARVVGGFITATSLQFLIQHRLLVVLKKRLMFHALDDEVKLVIRSQPAMRELFHWDLKESSELCLSSLEQIACHGVNSRNWIRVVASNMRQFLIKLKYGDTLLATDDEDLEKGDREVDQHNVHDESAAGTYLAQDMESGRHGTNQCLVEQLGKSLNNATCLMFPLFDLWGPVLCVLVAFGIVASVVGYVGCFSVVRGTHGSLEPIIWLLLEGILSIIRMVLWGWNPDSDDSDPIKVSIELGSNPPLSTCNKSADEIFDEGILPLVPAPEFLRLVEPYTGFLKPLDDTDTSVFYTLTRKSAHAPGIHQRVLFITLVNDKESGTRVYYEDNEKGPQVLGATHPTSNFTDYEGLETSIVGTIDLEITPTANNRSQWPALQLHYRSILEQLLLSDRGTNTLIDEVDMDWMLRNANTSRTVCPKVNNKEFTKFDDDIEQLVQGDLQRKRRLRCAAQRRWIESSLAQVDGETMQVLDMNQLTKVSVIESRVVLSMQERFSMELLLLHEIRTWEEDLRRGHQKLLQKHMTIKDGRDLLATTMRLKQDWVRHARTRLTGDQAAATSGLGEQRGRLAAFLPPVKRPGFSNEWNKLQLLLEEEWQILTQDYIQQDIPDDSMPKPPFVDQMKIYSRLHAALQLNASLEEENFGSDLSSRRWRKEREYRLEARVKDIEDWTDRGLAGCDVQLGHSSNWLYIPRPAVGQSKWTVLTPENIMDEGIETLSIALRRNSFLCFIQFSHFMNDDLLAAAVEMVHGMLSLTSISISDDSAIGAQTLLALENVVKRSPGIRSIITNDPYLDSIKHYVAETRGEHSSMNSLTFHGFVATHMPDLCILSNKSTNSVVELQLYGPKHIGLLLELAFQDIHPRTPSRRASWTLEVNGETLISSFLEARSPNKVVFILVPGRDFQPGSLNVLTCVLEADLPASCELWDVRLYDEDRHIYDANAILAVEARQQDFAALPYYEEIVELQSSVSDT